MPRVGLDLQMILQAAGKIADESGLDEVTLATLAKRLNIRPPSLYNHIDGLSGLRRKLAVYGMKQLNEAMTHAAAGRSRDDAVQAIGKAYIQFVRDHPGLYDALVRAPDWQDEETLRAAEQPMKLLVRVLAAYGIDGDAAIHLVRGLRSLLHGFASLSLSGNFNIPLSQDDSLRLVLDTFIAGIRSGRTEP